MSSPDVLVALIGARRRIPLIIESVTATLTAMDRRVIVVTGEQEGTDLHVRRECKRLGFRLISCHARWDTHGRGAGPERNQMIARLASQVIAWPAASRDTPAERQLSTGTWNCVEQFEARGKLVDIRDSAWTRKDQS